MATAEGLPLSHSLLSYYRARIEEFEAERALLIRKIEQCDVSHEVMHKTQWESRKKGEEIESLQRALNDAHMYLYDERQQLLQVYAENDELRVQELEDRRKIKQLLALTQPVNTEVTYFPGKEPVHMRRFPAEQEEAVAGVAVGSSSWAAARSSAKPDAPPRPPSPGSALPSGARGGGGVRVLRTVYMPNEQNETLLLTIESLRAQLAERVQLAADAEAAYKEDRARHAEEAQVRALEQAAKIDELLKANASLQALLTANTKEYLSFRHNAQLTQRLMKEDNEKLLAANKRLKHAADDVASRARLESKVARRGAKAASAEVATQLRAKAAAAADDAAAARASLNKATAEADDKIRRLTERLDSTSAELRRERKRWALEKEGYERSVAALRDSLRKAEADLWRAHAASADGAADDYELEVLNAALATAGRSKAFVGGLNRLRAQVRALENRAV